MKSKVEIARPTCRCGHGKASAFDGKCGHCRSRREATAHRKWVDDAPKREAQAEFLKRAERAARVALDRY
jgi:hypothetical protein